jgi:hypothetical protein
MVQRHFFGLRLFDGAMEHFCFVRVCDPEKSGAAKRFVHDLIGSRRIGVSPERWLILVRRGNHRQQPFESRKISIVYGRDDRFLHQMVARDESRVGRAHRGTPLGRLPTLLRKPMQGG